MKITEPTTRVYIGAQAEQNTEKTAQQTGRIGVFAGNIGVKNPLNTQMEEKRATAMEKAKKLLGDVFAAEKSVDDDLAERANRIKESEQTIVDANKKLKALEKEKEKLIEEYGVTGEETEEELPAEYKMRREELNRYAKPYPEIIEEARKVINEEQKLIAAIEVERLKTDPMVEASKEAEKLLDSAEEEISDMVMDAAVEQVKEQAEEAKETQKELEEKEELEEAKRKEREERRKEVELSEVPVQELLQLEQVRGEMKQEVDQMLTELKLLAEDIKGSMVDEEL